MIYTANQPQLLPACYMMNRYSMCDALILMDSAQYTVSGGQSSTLLADKNGNQQKFVIPLKNRSRSTIIDLEMVDTDRTVSDLLKTVQALYGKSKYYRDLKYSFEYSVIYAGLESGGLLHIFNLFILNWLLDNTLYRRPKVLSSESLIPHRGSLGASEYIAELGARIGASMYIGGSSVLGESGYIDLSDFNKRKIVYHAQNYKMDTYVKNGVSKATTSALDALFRIGPSSVRDLLNYGVFLDGP